MSNIFTHCTNLLLQIFQPTVHTFFLIFSPTVPICHFRYFSTLCMLFLVFLPTVPTYRYFDPKGNISLIFQPTVPPIITDILTHSLTFSLYFTTLWILLLIFKPTVLCISKHVNPTQIENISKREEQWKEKDRRSSQKRNICVQVQVTVPAF